MYFSKVLAPQTILRFSAPQSAYRPKTNLQDWDERNLPQKEPFVRHIFQDVPQKRTKQLVRKDSGFEKKHFCNGSKQQLSNIKNSEIRKSDI